MGSTAMDSKEEEPLDSPPPQPKSLKEKINYIKENITIEPILACYVIPGALSRLATQNLNLDKACRVNLKYEDAVCKALISKEGSYHQEELHVQKLIASMDIWKNILVTAIPSFLIIFMGAWSDRTKKRKLCILLPIVGDFLMCVSNLINTYYFYELPVQVTVFFEAFLPAITGSWVVMFMGTFSYISDISSKESRTFRVGVANLCFTAGGPIGSALSGIVLKELGYYGVFTTSALLYLFSLIYGLFYIKDPEKPVTEKPVESPGIWEFLKSFFHIKHVKDTLIVAFKKGPNNRRIKSILVLVSIAFIYGPGYGEYTIRYLFTRARFNWDALKYSFYNTFYICVHALGALISISLFSRRLKWDDSVLAFISSFSKLAGGIATASARNSFEMYLAVVIETFNATSYTALRSISSKLVSSAELGKMIALFNLMEVTTSMVFGPLYSWIYMMTLHIDAGFVYYISTVLTVPPLLIFIWFYTQHRKSIRQKPCPEENHDKEAQKPEEPQEKPLLEKKVTKDNAIKE